MAAGVPKKLLTMAGVSDCYTSARGQTATLGNFGEYIVELPRDGMQFLEREVNPGKILGPVGN